MSFDILTRPEGAGILGSSNTCYVGIVLRCLLERVVHGGNPHDHTRPLAQEKMRILFANLLLRLGLLECPLYCSLDNPILYL